jgi:hypothetical protein
MAKEAGVEGYASTSGAAIGTSKPVGHMDSLVVLLREIINAPAELFFGRGFGNGSKSSLECRSWGIIAGCSRLFQFLPRRDYY